MDQDKELLDLKAQVAAQAAQVEAQAAQVEAQAAEIARLKASLEGVTRTDTERDDDKGGGLTSRRGLFKLAGAAAVGAAGASLLSAAPAGATVGTMMFGAVNVAGTDLTGLTSTAGFATLRVTNDSVGSASGVIGETSGTGPGLGGLSTNGYGLAGAGGLAPLMLFPATTAGAPTTGTHRVGEVFVDANGALFQCVGAGTPGTWVRVGFNPVPATRILDTRPASHVGSITGPIGPGQTVSMAVAGTTGVPSQASTVVINATVAEGTAASFLTIWPEGATRPPTSNLNWSPGQFVANQVTVGVGTGGGISIFNNLGDVQVVLDLAGFYS